VPSSAPVTVTLLVSIRRSSRISSLTDAPLTAPPTPRATLPSGQLTRCDLSDGDDQAELPAITW
jgi:hypothetical protein